MESVMLLHCNELSHLCLAICILKVKLVRIKIKFQALNLELMSVQLLYTSKALQILKRRIWALLKSKWHNFLISNVGLDWLYNLK